MAGAGSIKDFLAQVEWGGAEEGFLDAVELVLLSSGISVRVAA